MTGLWSNLCLDSKALYLTHFHTVIRELYLGNYWDNTGVYSSLTLLWLFPSSGGYWISEMWATFCFLAGSMCSNIFPSSFTIPPQSAEFWHRREAGISLGRPAGWLEQTQDFHLLFLSSIATAKWAVAEEEPSRLSSKVKKGERRGGNKCMFNVSYAKNDICSKS